MNAVVHDIENVHDVSSNQLHIVIILCLLAIILHLQILCLFISMGLPLVL